MQPQSDRNNSIYWESSLTNVTDQSRYFIDLTLRKTVDRAQLKGTLEITNLAVTTITNFCLYFNRQSLIFGWTRSSFFMFKFEINLLLLSTLFLSAWKTIYK